MNSKLTPEKQQAFLAVLSETCLVGLACKAIGITRQTAYNWRDADPAFKEAWAKAEKVGGSVLEDEVTRRALEGQDEVTYIDGVAAKVVRKFSDKLLLAAVRARNPEKYSPSPKSNEPLNIQVKTGLPEERTPEEIAAALNNLRERVLMRLRDQEALKTANTNLDDLC